MATPLRIVLLEPLREDTEATRRLLSADTRFSVLATGAKPDSLEPLVREHRPDLALVALSFLRTGALRVSVRVLVERYRAKVLLLTDAVEAGTAAAKEEIARARTSGAVEVLLRPPLGQGPASERRRREFLDQVAACTPPNGLPPVERPGARAAAAPAHPIVVGVVSSAGGPVALCRLLKTPLPVPVLVAQHLPHGFVEGLKRMLELNTGRRVEIARNGEVARPETVYLAPDGLDLGVFPNLMLRVGHLTQKIPHPSADVLLQDLAVFGRGAVGVVLTGMGDDGLLGARRLKGAGGRILIQDRASCLVFGMPGAISEAGLADAAIAPEGIARQLLSWL